MMAFTRSRRPGPTSARRRAPGSAGERPAMLPRAATVPAQGFALRAVVLLGSRLAAEAPAPTAAVRSGRARRERVFDGTVEAVNRATVSAQPSGRVAEILYDVNAFVEAGAVIMRFTDAEQRAALRQAAAGLEEAEARFTEAEQEYTRVEGMFRNETGSRHRFGPAP